METPGVSHLDGQARDMDVLFGKRGDFADEPQPKQQRTSRMAADAFLSGKQTGTTQWKRMAA
jgi:hypothetical protein